MSILHLITQVLAACSMADHHKRGVEDGTLPPEAASSALEDADFHPQKGNTYKISS